MDLMGTSPRAEVITETEWTSAEIYVFLPGGKNIFIMSLREGTATDIMKKYWS